MIMRLILVKKIKLLSTLSIIFFQGSKQNQRFLFSTPNKIGKIKLKKQMAEVWKKELGLR